MILYSGALASACACTEGSTDGNAHFTEADLDNSVRIEDDFYQHTNGGWIAAHLVPADKSRYGTFDILAEESIDNLRSIVEEVKAKKGAQGTPAQKIGDLYALGMDTARRNADGIKPIEDLLAQVANVDPKNKAEFSVFLANFHKYASAFFAFGRTPDFENSSMNIAELWQSGIGLPDRDYYFDDSEHGKEIIEGYKKLLSTVFNYIGKIDADKKAVSVFEFEKKLAEVMNKKEENRDPIKVCNKYDFDKLADKAPNFDWNTYVKEQGVSPKVINVSQPRYFAAVFDIVDHTDKQVVVDYLTSSLVRSFGSDLTSELENIYFDFYSRQLRGTQELRPLWKRILGSVEDCLGEELGKLYVAKYFPEAAKKRMVDLIEQLRIAFGQRIDNLTWMGDSTKAAAKEKLAAITVKVGYPDKWRDYSKLNIDPNKSYVENLIEVAKFDHMTEMQKIDQPVDKDEWYMTPQTVNAYYMPTSNEIVFPAAILQPPFFYANGDDAVNYGAIGVVIGHEMTHGFDDSGCNFDKEGNLNNWWTESDKAQFDSIAKRLVDHFSSLTVIDDVKGNGQLTLGENIADLGGLNIAHQAFRNTLKGKAEPAPIDGQSAEQRFLLGYSRVWAGDVRPEYLRQQVMTDPHSAGRLRVNGQLPLLDFFYEAYNISETDSMYLPAEKRIVIW